MINKWLVIGLLLTSTLNAEIKEIQQFREIENRIGLSPIASDLVVFDIDYTLTEPEHPAFQLSALKRDKAKFRQEMAKFTDEQKIAIPILAITYAPNKLTDPVVPALVKKLQTEGATLLAFTASDTAPLPIIGDVPAWRQSELERLGISFKPTSENSLLPKERIEFQQFAPVRGTYPLYQDGILYSNVVPTKGAVLGAFLDKLEDQKPTKIIMVDDTAENLQSVEQELAKRGIPFLGLHYRGRGDATPPAPVSEEEWQNIWETIHKQANALTTPPAATEVSEEEPVLAVE